MREGLVETLMNGILSIFSLNNFSLSQIDFSLKTKTLITHENCTNFNKRGCLYENIFSSELNFFQLFRKLSRYHCAHIKSSLMPKSEEEIKTHFAREKRKRKTWRNYNEKQFGRKKKNEEWKTLLKRKRTKKKRFFCITINMKTIFLQYFPLK
jgi:hypothetical protein